MRIATTTEDSGAAADVSAACKHGMGMRSRRRAVGGFRVHGRRTWRNAGGV